MSGDCPHFFLKLESSYFQELFMLKMYKNKSTNTKYQQVPEHYILNILLLFWWKF